MSNKPDWIKARIGEARKSHTSVTEAVLDSIATQLRGQLTEKQLSSAELSSLGESLIKDMEDTPPPAEREA